ncbi:hypothetical protein PaecuDRAFT_2741 [Paenibacillus curdlanolyticus YK9]|uniref:Secreted protein n=1 Tax=Paenibacillus curdlanolyticus YK9 TaxID=717606 RepID=E0IB14_9BACL|nr:hypothetical protein [Paenibacillus curdlanolyticus]EFM10305.1 hypothetical protein PaecuDRAFT_2741 [Paenibacillus curdlanolyticus YK9]
MSKGSKVSALKRIGLLAVGVVTLGLIISGCDGPEDQAVNGQQIGMAEDHHMHEAGKQTDKGADMDMSVEMDHASMGHEHAGHAMDHSGLSETSDGIQAVMAAASDPLTAGRMETLKLQIEGNDRMPITKFDVSHEKLLHLIIVSEDLSDFRHVHPEYAGNGVFTVRTQFEHGGRYKWFADFVPDGAKSVTRSGWLTIDGKPIYDAPPLKADTKLEQEADGLRVKLSISETTHGKAAALAFRFYDAKTSQPVSDLQPYLGAVGHVVILSSDTERYLHVHPSDEKTSGPEAVFHTNFPNAGVYKVWGQFKRADRVITVPFIIEIR